MNTKKLTKLLFITLLALFATFGSGILAEQVGLSITPSIYACSSTGGGGC